jgi:hypothetical protein
MQSQAVAVAVAVSAFVRVRPRSPRLQLTLPLQLHLQFSAPVRGLPLRTVCLTKPRQRTPFPPTSPIRGPRTPLTKIETFAPMPSRQSSRDEIAPDA